MRLVACSAFYLLEESVGGRSDGPHQAMLQSHVQVLTVCDGLKEGMSLPL